MAFDWAEFERLAEAVAVAGQIGCSEEARLRTSVSRMYYAVYCCLRDLEACRHGFSAPKKGSVHKALREHVRARRGNVFARWLEQMHIYRCECDYETNLSSGTNLPSEQYLQIIWEHQKELASRVRAHPSS